MTDSMLLFVESNPTTDINLTWTAGDKKAFDLKLQHCMKMQNSACEQLR